VIQKEIIDELARLGIDCHARVHPLLVHDLTELTAFYRIVLRQRITEKTGPTPGAPHRRALPLPGRGAPFPAAGAGGPKVLATAVAAGMAGRRKSRPVAVLPNRALPGVAMTGPANAHEA
jgi:hypothetical protein